MNAHNDRAPAHARPANHIAVLRCIPGFPLAENCKHSNDRIGMPPAPNPGGMCRSEWSDVGCSHAGGCPLFPLLNASMRGWRDSYCDSEHRWRECARYQAASRGQLVPISLLPNGADVGHIRRAAERAAEAEGTQAPPVHSGSPEAAWFEPAPEPVRRPEPARPRPNPRPPENPSARSAPDQRQGRPVKRRWWQRFAEWMRGPA